MQMYNQVISILGTIVTNALTYGHVLSVNSSLCGTPTYTGPVQVYESPVCNPGLKIL